LRNLENLRSLLKAHFFTPLPTLNNIKQFLHTNQHSTQPLCPEPSCKASTNAQSLSKNHFPTNLREKHAAPQAAKAFECLRQLSTKILVDKANASKRFELRRNRNAFACLVIAALYNSIVCGKEIRGPNTAEFHCQFFGC